MSELYLLLVKFINIFHKPYDYEFQM